MVWIYGMYVGVYVWCVCMVYMYGVYVWCAYMVCIQWYGVPTSTWHTLRPHLKPDAINRGSVSHLLAQDIYNAGFYYYIMPCFK